MSTLELEAVIGFAGKVQGGLQWHANGTHLVYALGSTVIIKSLVDGSQSFLMGHTGVVTALALSKCGRFIASGQQSVMGAKVSAARSRPCVRSCGAARPRVTLLLAPPLFARQPRRARPRARPSTRIFPHHPPLPHPRRPSSCGTLRRASRRAAARRRRRA